MSERTLTAPLFTLCKFWRSGTAKSGSLLKKGELKKEGRPRSIENTEVLRFHEIFL
ncbi:hypothetical protein HMPREF9372_1917 [Sporosarcina newyorkensis 2681]|uniref:Uncharacterized protein n=1 Tax=Sporosarcina newyorkensis 2681 TaxID=1027292 RepID=F9DSY6_9BACL|nr:hypothetical protein HMPREF9372_1917 [Sporosarcina newyorkensis 2681]